ncbi:MAG: hypothetical protein Q4C82_05805 [Eubacteriales bacterium]|nr:hypothetical protein [Eubacteriales bacterium]
MAGKKKIGIVVKVFIFLALLLLMVYGINRTLTPKYLYRNGRSTNTYAGFYEMEPETVDVLLLGSSHTQCALNPQDIYDETEIRSYNLASSSQPMWISYYWLKEALQYQSPKVVILDCYMLFLELEENESAARIALNDMKNGSVKQEAIKTVTELDGSQTFLSYVLDNIRYHTRWTELEEADLAWWEADAGILAKGFSGVLEMCDDTTYEPLEPEASVEADEFEENAAVYLDRITELCDENGIELILIKTPTRAETLGRNAAVKTYADAHNLTFYDFNMKELYDKIGFEYASDMSDSAYDGVKNAHANPSGARKISRYLANEMLGVNGLTAVVDEQWEESRAFNEHIWENFELRNETDLASYIAMLDQERYTTFISVRYEASSRLNEEIDEAMRSLGFAFPLSEHYGYSYLAIKDGEVLTEIMEDDYVDASGTLREGRVPYYIFSAALDYGNNSSILIDGTEYSYNDRGINIVVYDNEIKTVIDQVCFDTYEPECTAYR